MDKIEFLKNVTVYMESIKRSEEGSLTKSSATGFYAKLEIDGTEKDVIITAKHFVEESDRIIFWMRYRENGIVTTAPITKAVSWKHIKDSDVAYCELNELEERFKKITGKKSYATVVTKAMMIKENDIADYDVMQKLIVVGYPQGIGSTWHKYPLFKRGYTASVPKDAQEDGAGYIDVCAIGGFSGSPIFIDGEELKFLGVLTSGLSEQDENFTPISMYAPAVKLMEQK